MPIKPGTKSYMYFTWNTLRVLSIKFAQLEHDVSYHTKLPMHLNTLNPFHAILMCTQKDQLEM